MTNTNSYKVSLITGGTKRIGRAICLQLHAAGHTVALHTRKPCTEATQLQLQLNAQRSYSCVLLQGDLSEPHNAARIIQDCITQTGRLDALINNASVFEPTPLTSEPLQSAQWNSLMNVNAQTPLFLAQAAAPHLAKQQGCIVNLVDIYAVRPTPEHTIYNASKAALASLTKSLALDLAPDIRVNGIAPGAILWPEQEGDSVKQLAMVARTPLKRKGCAEDIAKTALFLIDHAPFITGQIIAVDGGRSIVSS